MAFFYTNEQRKVIDTKKADVLVSAAAGSGKTAVLVERILRILTEIETPVSLDELLIVTFTNLAATEMRERIQKAIEERIEVEKDERLLRHLMKQIALMPTANIMTLHSFCLKLLKSYYHKVDLDPGFRIGNETELILVQEEVLDELFEAQYEEAREEFIRLIEMFSYHKSDDALKSILLRMATMARSYPWPKEWLYTSVIQTEFTLVKDFYESIYFQILQKKILLEIKKCRKHLQAIQELMELPEGPDKYQDTVEVLQEIINELHECMELKSYSEIFTVFQRDVPDLSRKTKGYDKELAKEAKERIDSVKEAMKLIQAMLIKEDSFLEEAKNIHESIKEFVNLTNQYLEAYQNAKRDKNIIDFSDIEHYTLALLYQEKEFSESAKYLKEQFYEVLVDEYQDINEVQEAILLGVAKREEPFNNLFMVGDLKQSIYRFRLAKPEIFREKYRHFIYEDGKQIKIDLAKNFRSRKYVLDFTNEIFEKIMSEEIGDVQYNEQTKLYFGSLDYEQDSMIYKPEIRIIEQKEKEFDFDIQCFDVVSQIKRLMEDSNFLVHDKNEGKRRVKYGDICILMRSPGTILPTLKKTFDMAAIPYASESSNGYFEAVEIQVILSYLKIIDNPYQEIPLAAILHSPFISCDENELLELRNLYQEDNLYEAVMKYILTEDYSIEIRKKIVLKEKLSRFIKQLEILRREALLRPIHELIERIYTLTGYKYFVSFMENGEQRKINLEYLITQARHFSESSYKGLFNFIRYIKHIEKYEVEVPEPLYQLENKSQVQIMSIHKSKGLEFPVVFFIQVQKQFNKIDLRQEYVLHQDLGMACDFVNPELRIRKESIFSKAIKLKSEQELLSEEIRLLYVALTRAREKLIIIGKTKDIEKCRGYQQKYAAYIKAIPIEEVESTKSYLDLFLMCFCEGESALHQMAYIQAEDIEKEYGVELLEKQEEVFFLEDLVEKSKEYQVSDENKVDKITFPSYLYQKQAATYANLSVSELKRFAQLLGENELEDYSQEFYKTRQMEKKVPKFIAEGSRHHRGSNYGVLMHTVLARLPFEDQYDQMKIESYLDHLLQSKIITKEERKKVHVSTVLDFTKSKLYHRMKKAYEVGWLYREQPFVLKVEMEGDLRMIQGIIDVYFYEVSEQGNKEIVLLDYKTDEVKNHQEDFLKEQYAVQLFYYKKALEEITEEQVTETYIYSLSMQKEIRI